MAENKFVFIKILLPFLLKKITNSKVLGINIDILKICWPKWIILKIYRLKRYLNFIFLILHRTRRVEIWTAITHHIERYEYLITIWAIIKLLESHYQLYGGWFEPRNFNFGCLVYVIASIAAVVYNLSCPHNYY